MHRVTMFRPEGMGFGASDLATAVLVLLALAAGILVLNRPAELSGRARVVDGDTLAIGGRTVRLVGLDAPEVAQSCGREAARYPCGERAREALRALAHGGDVACRVKGRDRYGRALARCTKDGSDMGAELVRGGLAVGYGAYAAEEREARRSGAGLWAGPFERPSEWRKARKNGGA